MPPIRLLLVDDHTMVRKGLRELLEKEPDLEIVGEAANGVEAILAVERLRPQVVLMDIQMPEMHGLEATRQIHSRYADIAIVMLSIVSADSEVFAAIKAGACGYIRKHAEPQEVLAAVRAAAQGEALIDPSIAVRVLKEFGRLWRPPQEALGVQLTEREVAILRLIADGHSNKEIGNTLGLAEKTIRNTLRGIFRKLQVHDRAQAAVYAVQHGLLPPPTR
jgi:DNA-binding NarL/FixJ family response regulator